MAFKKEFSQKAIQTKRTVTFIYEKSSPLANYLNSEKENEEEINIFFYLNYNIRKGIEDKIDKSKNTCNLWFRSIHIESHEKRGPFFCPQIAR